MHLVVRQERMYTISMCILASYLSLDFGCYEQEY